MSSAICGVASGPMSVDSSSGSPTFSASIAATKRFSKSSRDRLVHDEALRGDARLAVVDDARFHGRGDGFVEIRGRHHDERIAAAELQHRFLDVLRGDRGHARAGRLAAGERHGLHALIDDHALDLIRADQQRLELVVGEAGIAEDFLDRQRALRHVRGVLEHRHVAGHQRRRGEAEDLPEGEVPRHHRQDRPHRLVADERLLRVGLHRARRRDTPRRARRSSGRSSRTSPPRRRRL